MKSGYTLADEDKDIRIEVSADTEAEQENGYTAYVPDEIMKNKPYAEADFLVWMIIVISIMAWVLGIGCSIPGALLYIIVCAAMEASAVFIVSLMRKKYNEKLGRAENYSMIFYLHDRKRMLPIKDIAYEMDMPEKETKEELATLFMQGYLGNAVYSGDAVIFNGSTEDTDNIYTAYISNEMLESNKENALGGFWVGICLSMFIVPVMIFYGNLLLFMTIALGIILFCILYASCFSNEIEMARKYSALFSMSDRQNLSVREIADMLHMPEQTVKRELSFLFEHKYFDKASYTEEAVLIHDKPPISADKKTKPVETVHVPANMAYDMPVNRMNIPGNMGYNIPVNWVNVPANMAYNMPVNRMNVPANMGYNTPSNSENVPVMPVNTPASDNPALHVTEDIERMQKKLMINNDLGVECAKCGGSVKFARGQMVHRCEYCGTWLNRKDFMEDEE